MVEVEIPTRLPSQKTPTARPRSLRHSVWTHIT